MPPPTNPNAHFSSLFPTLAALPRDDAALTELGRSMVGPDDGAEGSLPLGYAIFGQFIGHDLTRNRTPVRTGPPAAAIPNFHSGRLDLDHLYHHGPASAPTLYDPAGRFRLGRTRPGGYPRDLPRREDGTAHLHDTRNDENLLIAQFTAVFLTFHNLVAAGLAAGTLAPVPGGGLDPFEQARRFVTWHYQWLVLHDFLPRILDDPATLEAAWREAPPAPDVPHAIPVEFAMAAFRFGHSMVRETCALNARHPRVTMEELFFHTGLQALDGGAVGGVPDDRVVDWRLFLELGTGPSEGNRCRLIGPWLAERLSRLPAAFGETEPAELAVRTLLRGAYFGLPSGQDVAGPAGLDVRVLTAAEIADHAPEAAGLVRHGFHERTPLWYYLLKEAEVLGGGTRLGPAGSRIVARVFVGCFRADPDCYPVARPGWRPTALPGCREEGDFTLADVVRFVGHDTMPWT